MKVNPTGIAAYTGVDSLAQAARQRERQQVASENTTAQAAERVRIQPNPEATGSSLAVKVGSDFAHLISPEERAALELLFERYAERGESRATYGAEGSAQRGPKLGAKVDFRV
ncbi:MAG TPA: hypothetical protein VLB27_10675 [candidate division Zixibacteria bacterium]|nr:hypothetical protein [candidate division Zixibacteria bacterium]